MKDFQKLAKLTLVWSVGLIGFAAIANAQSKPQNPETQLLPVQVQILKATGLRIALPTYIPAGFRLSSIQARAERSRVGELRYIIFYNRYDSNTGTEQCFTIEATNGGIGGIPPGSRSFPVNNATFGKSSLELGKYGTSKSPTLLSEWLGGTQGPFYRFAGAGINPDFGRCNNISPQEAVKVTESLRYLNP